MLSSALFAGSVLWSASFPGVPFVGVALVALFGCITLLSWLIWFAFDLSASRRVVAIVVGGVLVFSSVVVTATGAPLRARFAWSAAAFEAVIADADAHRGAPIRSEMAAAGEFDPEAFPIRCPESIGLFSISGCSVIEPTKHAPGAAGHRGYLFFETWNAVTDDSVIAYLPAGPIAWGWDPPRHLSGAWYGATCGC